MLLVSDNCKLIVFTEFRELANIKPTAASRLLKINYNKKIDTSEGLTYAMALGLHGIPWEKQEAQSKDSPNTNLLDDEKVDQFVQHIFPVGLGWAPERIEINGRKGRRVVCLVGKDKKQYRIYDIDGDNSVEGHGATEDDSADNMMT